MIICVFIKIFLHFSGFVLLYFIY